MWTVRTFFLELCFFCVALTIDRDRENLISDDRDYVAVTDCVVVEGTLLVVLRRAVKLYTTQRIHGVLGIPTAQPSQKLML